MNMKARKFLTGSIVFLVLIGLLVVYPSANYNTVKGRIEEAVDSISPKLVITNNIDQSKKPLDNVKDALKSDKLTEFKKQNIRRYQASTTRIKGESTITRIDYTFSFKNTKDDYEFALKKVRDHINSAGLKNMKEEDQLRSAYEYVINAYKYNMVTTTTEADKLKERNIANGLKGDPVVCDAYSMLLSIFLDELGYDHRIVKAKIIENGSELGHGWNIVKTSQGWYYMDATWGDSPNKSIQDKYFLESANTFSQRPGRYEFLGDFPKPNSTEYVSNKDEKPNSNSNAVSTNEDKSKDEDKPKEPVKEPVKEPNDKPIDIPIKEDRGSNTIIINNKRAYITGYKDGEFKGDNKISREEAATIISNIVDNEVFGNNNPFKDISKTNWSYNNILKISKLKIINGYSDGSFKPKKNISRAEALKLALSLKSLNFENNQGGHWAQAYIDYGLKNNIISGYSDGSFKPNNEITRAEFVSIINKVIDKGNPTTQRVNFKDINNKWYSNDVLKAANESR